MDNDLKNLQPEEAVLVPPVKEKRKFYWPTRILFLLTALLALAGIGRDLLAATSYCITLIEFCACSVDDFYIAVMMLNLLQTACSACPLFLIWSILFLILTGKIKRNPRYCRWMGIAPLMLAMRSACSVAISFLFNLTTKTLFNYVIYTTDFFGLIFNAAFAAFCLYLAIVFFAGTGKKTWIYIIALLGVLSMLGYNGILLVNNSFSLLMIYQPLTLANTFTLLLTFFSSGITFLGTVCFWAGLLSLMLPGKKAAAQTEIQ